MNMRGRRPHDNTMKHEEKRRQPLPFNVSVMISVNARAREVPVRDLGPGVTLHPQHRIDERLFE